MRLGMWILRLAIVAVPALSVVLLAQQASVTPALYMSAADVAKGLSTAVAADAAAGAAVTVAPNIVVRRRIGGGEPQYAIVHPFSIETYYIIEGAGSLVTDGVLDPPPPAPADPDVVRSKTIKHGATRRVAKGDVIVVPPGTPHWFDAIDGSITYLESRVRAK
jgi:mannose-6-phosphate isomerase-like protein (cupin superfamily)